MGMLWCNYGELAISATDVWQRFGPTEQMAVSDEDLEEFYSQLQET